LKINKTAANVGNPVKPRIEIDFPEEHREAQDNSINFACGTGRITSFLEGRVRTSTSADVHTSVLEIAKEKPKRTEIIQADITAENIFPR